VILADLPKRIGDYDSLSETEIIKVIIWWANTYAAKDAVDHDYLRQCYNTLGRAIPRGGFTAYLNSLVDRKPPHLIKSRQGFRVEHRAADALAVKYATRDATAHVEKLLADLPGKLANPNESEYLAEALICFKHRAFRASVVMAWNVAYDHLCYWILADPARVASFNIQMGKSYAKRNFPPIVTRESFEEPKESEILQVASSSGLITGSMFKVLKEKLDRRNIAAHPSGMTILESTAEEVIRELIENVVLKLV
jgi:hypothetical protein